MNTTTTTRPRKPIPPTDNEGGAVRLYLDGIVWDGVKRVGTPWKTTMRAPSRGAPSWLSTYLGSSDTLYTRDVGRRWLIASVARAFAPGCNVDGVLGLFGAQGTGKTRALHALGAPFFVESCAPRHFVGAWIVELDADISAVRLKKIAAGTIDRYRSPYARQAVEAKRSCVFAITSNDPSSARTRRSRRLWTIRTGTIDVDRLVRDRNQLWAEAVAAYRDGETWWR